MPIRSLTATVAPVFLAAVYLTTAPAVPHAQETTENPFTTNLDVRMGQRVFRQQCGRCHGRDGAGGELGPDLTNGFQNASTDAGLFSIVREGLPNTQMIGINRSATDQSVWMVVSYLNSLNDTADVDLPGDAAAGMQIFNGKGNCTNCHMVSGEGGRRGPELTRVGNRRDPDELLSALMTPDEDVAPRWWTVRVTREDGSIIEGLRMNEDTFTLRLMDEQEDLWSFSKGRIRSYERIETSIMPSVDGVLTAGEVDDLVAYLFSLRREES
ncbi:MAG: c-type cytochrome [Vicinamibacterales bacterium]|jgi:putative heme-binding domain-containing protein|nr:c-type cytochrome [Vicinamibacterales bacterium]